MKLIFIFLTPSVKLFPVEFSKGHHANLAWQTRNVSEALSSTHFIALKPIEWRSYCDNGSHFHKPDRVLRHDSFVCLLLFTYSCLCRLHFIGTITSVSRRLHQQRSSPCIRWRWVCVSCDRFAVASLQVSCLSETSNIYAYLYFILTATRAGTSLSRLWMLHRSKMKLSSVTIHRIA